MKKRVTVWITILISTMGLSGSVIFNGNQSSATLQNRVNKAANSDGLLKESFGNNSQNFLGTSYVHGSICGATGRSLLDQLTAIALQPDGKIVAVGFTNNDDNAICYFAIARFTADGQVDPTFVGGNGAISVTPGTVYIPSISGNHDRPSDRANSVIIQPDGKIVVGGYTTDTFFNICYALVRLDRDGSLDTTFGSTSENTKTVLPGTVYITKALSGATYFQDIIYSLALQTDKKVVAGGSSRDEGSSNQFCCFARFNEDGSLDTTFGKSEGDSVSVFPGTVFINGSLGGTTLTGYIYDNVVSIALKADNRLVAGVSTFSLPVWPAYAQSLFAVAQLTSEGVLDTAFGQNGVGTKVYIPGTVCIDECINGIPLSSNLVNDVPTSLVLEPSGKIILGGSTTTGSATYWALARFTTTGALDDTFHGNGITTTTLIPGTLYVSESLCGASLISGNVSDYLYRIALQNDGALIGAGTTHTLYGDVLWAVGRFTSAGPLDGTFGATGQGLIAKVPGTVFFDGGLTGASTGTVIDRMASVALEQDGSIVCGGFTETNPTPGYFVVAQFCNPQTPASYKKAYTKVGAGLNC